MDWLSHVPTTVWVALITSVVLALMARAGTRRVLSDGGGWTRLRPSVGMYVFGFAAVVMAMGCTFFIGLAVASGGNPGAASFVVIASPLALFLWYVVYAFLVVGTRFNTEGFEYQGLLKTLFVRWQDVRRIAYNGFSGPYAVTTRGGLLVSMYCQGFGQFIAEAQRHGIEIAPDIRVSLERT